jgi:hypothetical protein
LLGKVTVIIAIVSFIALLVILAKAAIIIAIGIAVVLLLYVFSCMYLVRTECKKLFKMIEEHIHSIGEFQFIVKKQNGFAKTLQEEVIKEKFLKWMREPSTYGTEISFKIEDKLNFDLMVVTIKSKEQ